jgi:hypothetical protein
MQGAQDVGRNCGPTMRNKREMTMRKTILTVLGVSLIGALTVQMADAAEHQRSRKVDRAASEHYRNSNAYAPAAQFAAEPGGPRYTGGISAPAGR